MSRSGAGASPAGSLRRTGWLTHELFYWHDSGNEGNVACVQPRLSSESPETKRRFANLVAVSPLADILVPLKPRPATDAELLKVHTPSYLERVKACGSGGGGYLDHELHMGPDGHVICALSAGGVVAALEAVLAGTCDNAVRLGVCAAMSLPLCAPSITLPTAPPPTHTHTQYALVRPPGHHAEADRGHGFCVYDNVAVAAEVALSRGLQRVAIVDIDVHHGNGPEQAFYSRSDVLYCSLHQDGLYPLHSGGVERSGEGLGAGYNLNVPLPPGCGIGAYRDAFARVVEPALAAFRPDVILVSCGFDAAFLDPLGRMMLTSAGFAELASRLRVAAEALCGGRLVFAHEGGYSDVYVPFCGLAVMEALSGAAAGPRFADPFIADVGPGTELQPHQAAAVTRAAANLAIALLPRAGGE